MKILAMPQTRATPAASSAAGPSPRMTTVLPATSKSSPSTVYTALPSGSWMVASSGGIDASLIQHTDSGTAKYSAKAPSQSTPRIFM